MAGFLVKRLMQSLFVVLVVTLLVSLVEIDSEMLAPMARVENYPWAALPSR